MLSFRPADILDMRVATEGCICISVRTKEALRAGDVVDLGRYSQWVIVELQTDPTPGVVTFLAKIKST